ncbi:MAG: NfeD family protein [Propionicimonas sp.]|uniref:NfeD family protein n=1 Tax=Propionicimonas sp. TaxID=1955623 RepID=UPI002B20E6CC|nr:NfeD family protein [Propionicimonas sp.]MEA4943072.1 NfeD family protein [Propionicimonas sp.]MEA5053908.1 NfeD family protein [Propionicimonas sp.]
MLEWLAENVWVVWLALGVGLAVTELSTLDFTLLMLAAGAVAGGITAIVLPGLFWVQLAVAVVVAVAMLALLRPTLLHRVRSMPGYRSSVDKLVGSSGTVTAEVTGETGEVKVAGEVWSARSVDGGAIPAGEQVEVYRIDGATLLVYPRHQALP